MKANYLYFVAYFPAFSLICSLVSFFGAIPGGLQVSRKKIAPGNRRDVKVGRANST
jgi:hypothetical protein